jgi:hypothetical protein
MSPKPVRSDFRRVLVVYVRVTPHGFVLRQTGEPVVDLTGHVVKQRLQRKLFLDGQIECSSGDGEVAYDGKIRCADCMHPLCRPQIRLELADRNALYLIDLAISSAQNFLDLEDALGAEGIALPKQRLRLTVVDRGYYGEIVFARVS